MKDNLRVPVLLPRISSEYIAWDEKELIPQFHV